jgi:hypothetical protein
MKDIETRKALRIIPLREKIIRLLLLAALFAICFMIVSMFSYDWVMYIVGCSYMYVFYCVYSGESVLPAIFRNRNRN